MRLRNEILALYQGTTESCREGGKKSGGFRICVRTPEFGKPEGRIADPLHYATPDFLWNLVALVHFMRLSLTERAYAALSSAAWQEIRVRSGRDDNSSWKLYLAFPNKIVIPSEAEGSAVRPSDFPNSGVLTQGLKP